MEKIEIIVPCYNEEKCIEPFYKAISSLWEEYQIKNDFSILFVDDGSRDHTLKEIKRIVEKYGDANIKYVSFSRNFGKEAALYAGLEKSSAEYVVVMDADLQHPPVLIPQMIERIESGEYECVGARRTNRKGEGKIRSLFSSAFYHVINRMTGLRLVPGMTDYRLMKRQVVDAILSLGEHERFIKGIYCWVGFSTYWIPYENVERQYGETKWSFRGLWNYAKSGFIAFATTPLRGIVYIGSWSVVVSVVYAFTVLFQTISGKRVWQDTTTIILLLLFLGGIIITTLGIIGEYLARIYMETKDRPQYILRETNI